MARSVVVGIVGALAAASTSVAASWAQPRETRIVPSAATERLFHLANCPIRQLEACKGNCASNDQKCITACETVCAFEK
jgi:hypothetical protein